MPYSPQGNMREVTADALAAHYRRKFAEDTGRQVEEYNGLWVTWDDDEKAYELRGEGLPAHPDLADQCPNGWSLIDYIAPEKAAELLSTPARALVIVDQGVAMVHTQGNVEVCMIDFDCVRDGDLQEMPPAFEAAFPAQAKELRDKTNEIGAWIAEESEKV